MNQDDGNEFNTNVWWFNKIVNWLKDVLEEYGIKLNIVNEYGTCLLYTSPSPRDRQKSRMPSSA